MNHEAESSRTGGSYGNHDTSSDIDPTIVAAAEERADKERAEEILKQRKLTAKKKRVAFLDHLLRDLDNLIFMELITIYYLDCSFFWFFVRAIIQVTILTPLPDLALAAQREEQKPFLPLVLTFWLICSVLHLTYPRPSAGEETRGYLHGGLSIDFIGQQGPTSKLHLVVLDLFVMIVQLVMVSVHVKRRELRKRLPRSQGGTGPGESTQERSAEGAVASNTNREQDADSEERGVLRRSDSLSEVGDGPDEEDQLLPPREDTRAGSSSPMTVDAFDALNSGQAVVADLYVIDTLLQEHESYQAQRQAVRGSGTTTSLTPTTLRQLNSIRVRLGGG